MGIAVIHDIKLDSTVPGNVWIAGNIIGRLVGCYYIGGIDLIVWTPYDMIYFIWYPSSDMRHIICHIWYKLNETSHKIWVIIFTKSNKDLFLVTRERNLDATQLNLDVKMYVSTCLRNQFALYFSILTDFRCLCGHMVSGPLFHEFSKSQYQHIGFGAFKLSWPRFRWWYIQL